MKKNILFIYRGQVLKSEFLPKYEKYLEENCILLVEKGPSYNTISLLINKLGLNVILMTHDDLLEDKINMKFDSIVMNPPYKGGLHIDIFNKSFDLLKDGGKLTCIHPSTPFITRKPTRIDKKTKLIKNIISDYESTLTLVDGNKLFNAGFFAPLSITEIVKVKSSNINVRFNHIDENNSINYRFDSLDDVFMHGSPLVSEIHKKVIRLMGVSVDSKLTRRGSRGNFYLKINSIVGNIPKNDTINPDFNCIIYKENEDSFEQLLTTDFINGDTMYVSLETRLEAHNFFKYCMTKFARFCVSFYKINQHIDRGELKALPYLDFSQEWTDEMLFDYFDFNDEEINFIKSYIGNWYDRDFE